MSEKPRGITRRDALIAGGGVVIGAAGAAAISALVPAASPSATQGGGTAAVSAAGKQQAGVARPATPQRNGLISVFDLADTPSLGEQLTALTAGIVACTNGTDADTTPDGAGDLSITIGLGPRIIGGIDPALPGATDLPLFDGDEAVPIEVRGGDLLIGVYASDVGVLHPVLRRLLREVGDTTLRWQQQGYRSTGHGTVARNPLGFKDGITVPHGTEELDDNVWIQEGALAGGTICVIRRLRLRTDDFRSQPVERQDEIIGRHRLDGSPLSGGGPDAQIDVNAKTAAGELQTPSRSHVRAAHPSFTGSALMLRRGYSFSNGPIALDDGSIVDDQGLVFMCFQHDLSTFVKSQQRIDELDDLRQFTTVTASGTFLILPGFTASKPLGSTILS